MVGGLIRGRCGKGRPGCGVWSARIAIEVGIIVSIFRVFLTWWGEIVLLLEEGGCGVSEEERWRGRS